ncbi:MAG: insulinase family protein [Armatimonadetes bacterium]|nr:insulinase family protein [Armatimonadota bacterium]
MGITKKVTGSGVRVLAEPVGHVGSVSIGLWCRTGSVNEQDAEAGITHLIEHMLFKGTPNRGAKKIAEEIEGRGGMLNAFTDKEQTCYYCRVLARDAEVAIDVLCDMVLNSSIEPVELKREQGVVLEEIKRGEDEPGDHVHDLHIEGLWDGHRLGKPVIGTRESVSSFQRDHLVGYMGRRYRSGQLLLAAAGNIDPDEVYRAVEQRLGGVPSGTDPEPMERPGPKPGTNLVSKDVEQVHFCIGTEGTSVYDEDLYPMAVLDGILGGGMSSRLFQEVRERRGLAYAVGSYHLSYTAGGAFTVYGGTGQQTWNEVQEVVRAEFDKVMDGQVTEEELARVKRNISGTMVLALEGMSARMMRMAKNELNHGREIPVEETLAKIDAVTLADVTELARRVLPVEKVRTTAIGAF